MKLKHCQANCLHLRDNKMEVHKAAGEEEVDLHKYKAEIGDDQSPVMESLELSEAPVSV